MNNVTPGNVGRVQRMNFVSFGQEEPQPEPVTEPHAQEVSHPPLEVIDLPKLVPEEALIAARQEGHAQGYKDGVAVTLAEVNKEEAQREEAVASVLQVIASRITLAAEEHTAYMTRQQAVMSKLALAIGRKIAGDAVKTGPYEHVEALLRECLALIVGRPNITVVVPPVLSAGLRQRIDALKPLLQGFTGGIAVEEAPDMKEDDCRVEWENGYAERDTAKLWKDIETIIAGQRNILHGK